MRPSLTMNPSLKYAATGVVAVGLIAAALWPFLDPTAREGILIAAAVAIPVQVVAFAILNRFRDDPSGFLAAWLGGTAVRMVVIAVAAFLVIRSGMEGAVPMLLALAGFLFGLLLLEPLYFGSDRPATTRGGRSAPVADEPSTKRPSTVDAPSAADEPSTKRPSTVDAPSAADEPSTETVDA